MKRKALGKGLSALLPDPEPAAAPAAAEPTSEAPVASLEPNPFQPRSAMDPTRLAELSASIRESGIVQPILVRRHGERYQIIAGERRWRA
jgi:ParB family chromosome partitioning protein